MKIKQTLSEIRRVDDQHAGTAFTGDLTQIEGVSNSDLEKDLKKLKTQKAMIYASIWNGSHPIINSWITKLAASADNLAPNLLKEKIKHDLPENLERYSIFSREQDQQLKSQGTTLNANLIFNNLDLNTKKALINNPSIWTNFKKYATEDSDIDLNEFNCRVQGKYGKGEDYLDNAMMGASLALTAFGGGATLLLKAPQVLVRGVSLSEKAFGITEASAEILLYSATTIDSLSVVGEIDKECLSNRPEILHSGTSSCALNDQSSVEQFEIASQIEKNCILAVALNARPGVAALAILKKANTYAKREQQVSTLSDPRAESSVLTSDRRLHELKFGIPAYEGKANPIEVQSIANMPEGMRVVEVKNREGLNMLFAEYAEKLSDRRVVRNSREIQLDSLTGAIDGNYPGGRDFFEMMAKAKAGKAHFAFIDIGSLGAVNKTFKSGKKVGDDYIKAVAKAINETPLGKGKITLTRMGGDEFSMIIDETDPKKLQAILYDIQARIRATDGDAYKVFRDQKIELVRAYKGNPTEENIQAIKDFAKIQQPDISIGSTQIGGADDLKSLSARSEAQATIGKTNTAIHFARDPGKYGSNAIPRAIPQTRFRSEIQPPAASPTWHKTARSPTAVNLDDLATMKMKSIGEINRFGNYSIKKYQSELGNESFRLEHFYEDPILKKKVQTSYEIPIRAQTGMLDGTHIYSKDLILKHFRSDPNNILLMPKLGNLRELNYFAKGTQVGDQVMTIAAEIINTTVKRSSDLKFKLGGSDYLVSLDKPNPSTAKQIAEDIVQKFNRDPRILNIINEENVFGTVKLRASEL